MKEKLRPIIGDWVDVGLHKEFNRSYMKNLQKKVRHDRKKYTVYPKSEDVFRALRCTPPEDVKCVILGQDPYHDGNANGLAFSNDGDYENISPSLRNIFKEVERDIGFDDVSPNPDLTRWAKQGVLLFNTTLTVKEGQPQSHSNIGWKQFSQQVLRWCSLSDQFVVFMLWGKKAQSFMNTHPVAIDPFANNRILKASHPSPYSAHISFHGCGHFSTCNEVLIENELEPINW